MKQPAKPGQHLDFRAEVAPDARAASPGVPSGMVAFDAHASRRQRISEKFHHGIRSEREAGRVIDVHVQSQACAGAFSFGWPVPTEFGTSWAFPGRAAIVAIAPRMKLRRAIMLGSPNGWIAFQFINSIRLRAPASIRYH